MKLVVFGGNGFVGQRVVQAALRLGLKPVSISRSGVPPNGLNARKSFGASMSDVEWAKGDVFDPPSYAEHLKGACGVVSCLGAFGSMEFMEKMNGDANILAQKESVKQGVPRFVYISTVENTLPEFVLKGYFHGKRRAEQSLLDLYPDRTGIVLRPSFVFGTRDVSPTTQIPLGLLGAPLKAILGLPGFNHLKHLPFMRAILACPVSVEDVGLVAAAAAAPPEALLPFEVSTVTSESIIPEDDITKIAEKLRVARRLQ